MPVKRTTARGYQNARELRQAQTQHEVILWNYLRKRHIHGARFRRQHALGPYVVDFCSPNKKLVIELDGAQHRELADYDADRTTYLEGLGYRVLRFWNHEVVNDIQKVLQKIDLALKEKQEEAPSPKCNHLGEGRGRGRGGLG